MRSSAQTRASRSSKNKIAIMGEDREFLKAKNYTFKLLSYRQRSTKEINERLKKRGFAPRVIKQTIEYLSQLQFLNDESFAKSWIQAKIQSKPSGRFLLRYQLRQKGVAEEVLEKVFSEYLSQYNEADAARKLAASRRKRYKGLESPKVKKRLYDYLCRRGFTQEAILQAIDRKGESA